MLKPFATLLLAALAVVTPAVAQEDPADLAAARELFDEGIALSRAERWEEAYERLARALTLKRSPAVLYSLAVAEMNSGRLVAAREHFRAFLAEPSSPATEAFEAPARAAREALERRVARLVLVVDPRPEDVRASLDGVAVAPASWGRTRLLDPGEHELVVEAPGHEPLRRVFRLAEGEKREVRAQLTPRPPKGPTESSIEPESASWAAPIALLAGGATVFGVGLAVGVVGYEEAGAVTSPDGPEADAAFEKALAGDILMAAGVATAAAGLVWLLVAESATANARFDGLRWRF